ncbi:hypothetical protein TOT_040000854 [Theileria orientalis strain Shintoku]|uniref:Uncharacterized protein n=1 Tax=Theileria orientalis strain Shintoku TaxID=869250 RepID=J7MCF9_THEOR|nr:hypothetical protein TOT_040000854 [Theileria orientalis strain Shintoku]PVC49849.1 hypothetical protein MACL_00002723 [Theileria orientalis]BAM42487.1 hypothetical protein TOT_040000854 [Theileria orientalis strain Shintoku]|eukprot:XP_009692788.1 hypothetical protein TOT_040000854 [Theileria orientalis strain Shintoku]
MFGGVLKALVVIYVSSQYNLWSMAHELNFGKSSFMSKLNSLSDGQDDLITWLYGPYKKVPIYGQDPLDQWLYGPNLSQKPVEENLTTSFKTFKAPAKSTESLEKKFEFSVPKVTENTSHVTSVDVPSDSLSCGDESDEDVPYAPRNIKYPF